MAGWCGPFKPIRPHYLYRLPSVARIVEFEAERLVTWEVTALPGFRARHSYTFEPLDRTSTRFGSSEVAEGPLYTALVHDDGTTTLKQLRVVDEQSRELLVCQSGEPEVTGTDVIVKLGPSPVEMTTERTSPYRARKLA